MVVIAVVVVTAAVVVAVVVAATMALAGAASVAGVLTSEHDYGDALHLLLHTCEALGQR